MQSPRRREKALVDPKRSNPTICLNSIGLSSSRHELIRSILLEFRTGRLEISSILLKGHRTRSWRGLLSDLTLPGRHIACKMVVGGREGRSGLEGVPALLWDSRGLRQEGGAAQGDRELIAILREGIEVPRFVAGGGLHPVLRGVVGFQTVAGVAEELGG